MQAVMRPMNVSSYSELCTLHYLKFYKMKNKLVMAGMVTCLMGNVNAQSPDWLWAKGMAGAND